MSGYLELIVGPMFSGKTTALLDIYEQNKDKSIVVLNYNLDKRYDESMLSTHDKKMIPCIHVNMISEIWKKQSNHPIHSAELILINEGQFFDDLFEIVLDMVENGKKHVYICGLDGDYQRKKFGNLLDLVPHCDKITKLNANCVCGKPAIFSHRFVHVKNQVLIGSSDSYIPLCRDCYSEKNI